MLANGRRQPDAARAVRRAAALAHRQRGEEPLLLPRSRRPAVHGDRQRRRAAGAAGRRRDILLVTPGERVDVIVTPKGKAGTPLALRAMLYNRGYGSVEYRSVEDVLTIEFTKEPPLAAKRRADGDARDRRAVSRGRDAGGRRADAAADGEQQVGVPRQRRAVLEGEAVPREARRDAALDRQERHRLGPPVPPARLLLPGRRREGRSRCGRWRGKTRSTCR